ncbi:hypothetical protein COX74_02565, partial [bacterium (Candidatus Gribaldobacteria) CG_4_10_14_0_2_um_filter_41_16]
SKHFARLPRLARKSKISLRNSFATISVFIDANVFIAAALSPTGGSFRLITKRSNMVLSYFLRIIL